VTQAVKKICDVYGHDAVSVRVAGSFLIWKFLCQKCTSLWSINHWKNRWSHGKSWERSAH